MTSTLMKLNVNARRTISLAALAALCAAGAAPAMAQSGNPQRDRVQAIEAKMAKYWGVDLNAQPEVVGGKTAKDGRWPFMVALLDAGTASNYDAQFCGASLISSRDVLTAAHCVKGSKPAQIQVLVGTQDLKSGGRRVNIARITVHPKYNSRTSDSDVAVLRLAEEVTDITPVEYASTLAEEDKYAAAGKPVWGMGWGETETTPHFPNQLQNVKVPVTDRTVCNAADAYNGKVTDTMLCAGLAEGGKDTCQGDSGGPLVAKNGDGQFHLQVGVVSWGYGCADPNHYGIYSRMATLGAWVKDQVAAP
ncbi:serine protease [Ideonella sp. DXS29W]|uniref:Serine protease n=1 Tax=Ideonella lacteola TaxID=2984193 RepID=A0ABU9BX18_9BURK